MSSDTGQEAPSASPNGTTATDTTLAVDKSKRDDDEAPLPPYPPNLRPLLFHFVRQMRDVLGFSERAHKTGDVVRTRLLGRGDDFHLAHPDHLKRVLLTEREKFRKSDDFRVAFGEGLLTVEGEKWQRQRNALQLLFARDSVIGYG